MAVRIINKNIFKIVNNICILTNTNTLFLCSNILKFKDLITYTNILFISPHSSQCTFKEIPKQNIIKNLTYLKYDDLGSSRKKNIYIYLLTSPL